MCIRGPNLLETLRHHMLFGLQTAPKWSLKPTDLWEILPWCIGPAQDSLARWIQDRSEPYLSRDKTQQVLKLSASASVRPHTHTQKKGNRATVEDGWEVSSVGIKNIIREDIWAGSIWTRNLGRTLNLWESKGFAVTSKFSWLCVSVFSFSFLKNNRARGEEGGRKIFLQFSMLDAVRKREREREIKGAEQRGREGGEEKMFLCSTRSETATCSALCSFQSLAKLLLLQTVELNLQRVLLGQLKKKKNKKKNVFLSVWYQSLQN